MAHPSYPMRLLVIALTILCVSCEKDSSIAPRSTSVPTVSVGANGQDNGAYVSKNNFQVGMCTCLTGLAAPINMIQSNYVETPGGNRTSVWTGTVSADIMPPLTLDPVTGISSFRFVSYWNGDGDGIYYDSECIVTADGVATLTLHAKKAKK